MKTVVYIDGFNLYYGALKGTTNKWLNLESYFTRLLPHDQISAIKYFSAPVNGAAGVRQSAYLLALDTLPLVSVILGKFKKKTATCHVAACSFAGDRRYQTSEEKRTDVNIAVHLLDDVYQDNADKLVIVSGDSDLIPPIQMVRSRFPNKKIVVYVPANNLIRGAAVELRSAAHANRTLPENLLAKSQFPASVPNGSGSFIAKPSSW